MPRPPLVRAVVDTNLIVRGILRRRAQSGAVRLLDAFLDDQFTLVTSDYILDEVRKTLREPDVRKVASLSDELIEATVAAFASAAIVVAGDFAVEMVPTDPKDNPIIACALEGHATFVVTDDRADLLPLKVVRVGGHRPVQIVTPNDFLRHHLRRPR